MNRQLLVVSFPIVGNYRNYNPILSREICLEIDKSWGLSWKFLFRGKNQDGWSMRKAVEQNADMAVGEMLGFDLLH
jgi:hypothetical protein